MINAYLLVDSLGAISLIGLAIVVLMRNRNLEANRVFALFSLFVSIWIISNYISNNTRYSPNVAIIANYLVFPFSYAAIVCLIWFTVGLAEDIKSRRIFKKLMPLIVLIGLLGATPLVVAGVKVQGAVYAVIFGKLAPVYFGSLLLLIISSVYIMKRDERRSSGIMKDRLRILFLSWVLSLPIIVLSNFILPTATGWFGLSNIGTLPMLITVFGLYYSVVKHKLFDLRLIIVRSLTYVVTLGLLSVFYGVTTYYVTTLITTAHNTALNYALNVFVIIVVVSAYPPLRKLFNRISNKFFYQDAYDMQELYDHLNRVLVSTLDLNKLLNDSSVLIVDSIKADFCFFSIKGTDYSSQRLISSEKKVIDQQQIVLLHSMTQKLHSSVIAADFLESEDARLKQVLDEDNIAVLVRLASNVRKDDEGLGYMALGPKKSGNPYSDQDLRVLDTVAKELIIAIQNAQHFEEIQNFNVTLQDKIDQATYQLRKANEKLKALDETKDDFISMASHQLRTPLTSIKGYISMVLEGDAGKLPPTASEMLGQAFFSSQRMVYLISDLLNVSRLKTGKFVIEKNQINLATMVDQELKQLKETATSRHLTLDFEKPADFPDLMLDETKTRQVIMNFVDNAIYYTPAGGHIKVRLIDNPSTVELRVEDDGIGVSKSDQPHLFTKFYRAGNARKARPDGTGLGLFMAKKVIIAEEGSLIFESVEGKGSTFGFVFSKSKVGADTKTLATPSSQRGLG